MPEQDIFAVVVEELLNAVALLVIDTPGEVHDQLFDCRPGGGFDHGRPQCRRWWATHSASVGKLPRAQIAVTRSGKAARANSAIAVTSESV